MDLNKQALIANKFFETKSYDRAIAVYVQLVKLSEYKHLKNNLGYCYQALNRHSDAKTVWLEHLTENKNAIHLYLALAYGAGQMQEWNEMKEYSLKALETKQYKEESYAWQQLSIAEYYLEDYTAALSAAKKGIRHHPRNEYLLYYACLAECQLKDATTAAADMVQILRYQPNFVNDFIDNANEKLLLTTIIGDVLAAAPAFKALVEKTQFPGDQIKSSTVGGISWLAIAANKGHVEAIEQLLAKGFDVDECDRDKATPLMKAVENGAQAVVELLLKNGAEIAKRDLYGRTAYSYAIKKGIWEIKALIRKAISVSTAYGFPVPSNFIHNAVNIEASAKPAMLIEVSPIPSHTNTFFCEEVVESSPHCEKCGEKYRVFWQVDFSEVRILNWIPEIIWKAYTHFYCSADPTGPDEVRFKFSIERDGSTLQDRPTKYLPAQYHPFRSVPSAHASEVPISTQIDLEFKDQDGGLVSGWAAYNFFEEFFIEGKLISRIGGYAPWIQYEEDTPLCEDCGLKKEFIAALGSDDTDILFGDSGYFYFFACPHHSNSLEKCTVIHQCY